MDSTQFFLEKDFFYAILFRLTNEPRPPGILRMIILIIVIKDYKKKDLS